jgi:hypothetical protein
VNVAILKNVFTSRENCKLILKGPFVFCCRVRFALFVLVGIGARGLYASIIIAIVSQVGFGFAFGLKFSEFAESVSNSVFLQNSFNGDFLAVTFREFNGLVSCVGLAFAVFSPMTGFAAVVAFIGLSCGVSGSVIGDGVKDFHHRWLDNLGLSGLAVS